MKPDPTPQDESQQQQTPAAPVQPANTGINGLPDPGAWRTEGMNASIPATADIVQLSSTSTPVPLDVAPEPVIDTADNRPGPFDFDGWAAAIPLSIVNDKELPSVIGEDGRAATRACSLIGTSSDEPCWGRVQPIDHPMDLTSATKYSCRGHFWKISGGGPYVAKPVAKAS